MLSFLLWQLEAVMGRLGHLPAFGAGTVSLSFRPGWSLQGGTAVLLSNHVSRVVLGHSFGICKLCKLACYY